MKEKLQFKFKIKWMKEYKVLIQVKSKIIIVSFKKW